MINLLKSSLYVFLFYSFPIFSNVITGPGGWRYDKLETIYIDCIATNMENGVLKCQISEDGKFYALNCPELVEIEVELKRLNQSYYCYAKKMECHEPIACAILEKVVYQAGADLCQHGELKTDRKCQKEETYHFDKKSQGKDLPPIVDQCCRLSEIFSRPGVSM